jgi:hypothetical protein
MKSQFLIVAALFALVLTSCKNESDTKKTESTENVEVMPEFKAEFDVVTDKDDDIALYYTEDGSISFTPEKVYWSPIKAGKDFQKIIFSVPDEHVPNSIRVDFGAKRGAEQGNIVLRGFKISCYNKTIQGDGKNFLSYFDKNNLAEVDIDSTAGTITFKQDLKNNANHFFYPSKLLLDELKKMQN